MRPRPLSNGLCIGYDRSVDVLHVQSCCKLGIGVKSVAGAVPPASVRPPHIVALRHSNIADACPSLVIPDIRRHIHLAHARIEAREHAWPPASAPCRLCDRAQGRHAEYRQIGTQRESLHDATSDAHSGEGAWPGPVSNTCELHERRSSVREYPRGQREQSLRRRASRAFARDDGRLPVVYRNGQPGGGSVERQDLHDAF